MVYQAGDADGTGIYMRRFDAAGAALGGAVLVNTETDKDQQGPTIAMDDAGNYVIAWHSYEQDGSDWGVHAQRFNSSGTAVGTEFQVNTYTNNNQSAPRAAMAADGHFVIVWHSSTQDGSGWGVYGQRYNADGSKAGGEFRVNAYTYSDQSDPSVGIDSSGNFVVAWTSYQYDGYDIFGQRFASDGAAIGGEFHVNTYTNGYQQQPRVAMAGDGAFVIAWGDSNGYDGSSWGVFAQRYAAGGVVVGGEFRANSSTNGEQYYPSAAWGVDGNFLIAWQGYQADWDYGVHAQLFGIGLAEPDLLPLSTSAPLGLHAGDPFTATTSFRNQGGADAGAFNARYYLSTDAVITAADTPLGGAFPVSGLNAATTANDTRTLDIPAGQAAGTYYLGILLDPDGAVTEADEANNGTAAQVFAQIAVSTPPAKLDGQFRVNRTIRGEQGSLKIAGNASNQFVAVWQGPNVNSYEGTDVYFQRLNAYGSPLGPETQVHDTWSGFQGDPDVAVAPDGSFRMVYEAADADGTGIYLRRFNADGTPASTPVRVNTETADEQTNPAIAVDANGKFVVVWQSLGQDSDNWGVFGQRYNADGTKAGGEFPINTRIANEQRDPSVAMDDAGNFVVAWHSYNQDGSSWGVFAQRYNANGTIAGAEFQVNTFTNSEQSWPSVAMDTDGDFVVVWQSYHDGDSYGVFAQVYGSGLAQPDLVPVLTSAPAGANLNAILRVSSEIRNQGTQVDAPFTARYYISPDPVITEADVPLGSPFTIDGIGELATITNSSEILLQPTPPRASSTSGCCSTWMPQLRKETKPTTAPPWSVSPARSSTLRLRRWAASSASAAPRAGTKRMSRPTATPTATSSWSGRARTSKASAATTCSFSGTTRWARRWDPRSASVPIGAANKSTPTWRWTPTATSSSSGTTTIRMAATTASSGSVTTQPDRRRAWNSRSITSPTTTRSIPVRPWTPTAISSWSGTATARTEATTPLSAGGTAPTASRGATIGSSIRLSQAARNTPVST